MLKQTRAKSISVEEKSHGCISLHLYYATALFIKSLLKRAQHWYPCLTTRLVYIINKRKIYASSFYAPGVICHITNSSFFFPQTKNVIIQIIFGSMWPFEHSASKQHSLILTCYFSSSPWLKTEDIILAKHGVFSLCTWLTTGSIYVVLAPPCVGSTYQLRI